LSSSSVVEVALALVRRQGCLLVTRRVQGAHLAGYWEFPGGKCLPGESPGACAEREALEEVGVACRALWERPTIEFTYPERSVRLCPVECEYLGGAPKPLQVAEWAWVLPADLHQHRFPPANEELLEQLKVEG
jgi:8-oxo-dGTP diphosphatase